MGDTMKLFIVLRLLQRQRDSPQRICFGGISDLGNSDLPVVAKNSAHSLHFCLFSAELLANLVNSE